MKLKDLFMSYLNMNDSERILFINELQSRRISTKIEKTRKKKVELSVEEQFLLNKVLGSIK